MGTKKSVKAAARKARCENKRNRGAKPVRRDGIYLNTSLESVSLHNDEHQDIRSVIIDSTARTQAEEEVLKVNTELEEKVKELQREVAQRRRAEELLRESEKRLHALSYQLLTAQEAERKRIARELHDSIGQSLVAIRFALERKLGQMGKGEKPAGISLEDILNMVQNSVMENQRISTNLRPPTLDDLGVVATLNWFVRELQKTYPHLRIDRQIHLEEKDVADHLKTVIFRVFQEAANNIIRHSRGDLLSLILRKVDKTIELMIQDNGVGFNPVTTPRGLGLTSMEERVKLSGGTFGIESVKGKGTKIQSVWSAKRSRGTK